MAEEAEANRTWCVRADDAAASTAWTPASGTAGDTSVGVLSGDPRHSAAIRDAITAGLRSGTIAARHHRSRLAGVALVGGGPGDPGLITVRGRQLLAEADVVIADRLGPRELLAELSPDVMVIDAGKVPYRRQMSQDEINEALVTHATSGKFVVRLKGGDPFVFGRGGEEMLACLRAGVPVTVVPGVSSAIGVPTAAGLPVTHRGTAQDFHVISVHVPPGDERSTVDWPALARSDGNPGAPDVTGTHRGGHEHAHETWTAGGLSCFGNRGRYHAHTAHNLFNARRRREATSGRRRPATGRGSYRRRGGYRGGTRRARPGSGRLGQRWRARRRWPGARPFAGTPAGEGQLTRKNQAGPWKVGA